MYLLSLDRVEDRTLRHVLEKLSGHVGDDPWILEDEAVVSFGEAFATAERIARGLRDIGVDGDRPVTLFMQPSRHLVLAGLGAALAGSFFSPINTDFRGEFLASSVTRTTAHVLVVDEDLVPVVLPVADRLGLTHLIVNGKADPGLAGHGFEVLELAGVGEGSQAHLPEVRYGDRMMMWWSSGTTGQPKGIVHSHASLLRAAAMRAGERGLRPDDRFYTCLPMYLGGAWTNGVWPALVSGLPVGIDPRFSVSRFWDRTRFYQATNVLTLGAMHMYLLNAPEKPDDADNPIRYFMPVPMAHDAMARFKQRFNIERTEQTYGLSEAPCRIFYAPDDGTKWKNASIGKAAPWLEVKLVDENDAEVAVGEVGEIAIRGREPNLLFEGYFGDEERTAKAWRGGWFHTGDLARIDEDGEYFFADRKADYIRHKGRNISMVEVEEIVRAHPDVAEVAAFGITTPELESEAELMISVVPRDGKHLDPAALARFVNDNAPYFFVPYYIDVLGELPHNGQFKVEKTKLRARGVTPATWVREQSGFVVQR
jgi:crotonobetaine/carnitine-CoA ligase